jgi:hypothetical protein
MKLTQAIHPMRGMPFFLQRHSLLILLGLIACCLPWAAFSQGKPAWVKTYPYPSDAPASTRYQATVNGQPAFIYQNPVGSILIFEMEGEVELEIEVSHLVKFAQVRPLTDSVVPTWHDQRIHLRLVQPARLSLELNGQTTHPLFIIAHPRLAAPKPSKNLRIFAAGQRHRIGIQVIQPGETVYLEGGAVVEGAFLAPKADGVTIAGPGIIEASGGDTLSYGKYRRSVINLLDGEGIQLREVCISDGRTWEVVPDRCHNVQIDGISILSEADVDDGIDLVRSSQVRISNCLIHTKDDCIAIKAHSPDSLLRATHDVEVRNCVFWNAEWGNGFEIGFELRSERIYDIHVVDCDFIHVESGAVLSIHNADFATVEDILFEDIRVEDARQKLLDIAIFWTWFSLDAPRQEEYQARYQQGGIWDNVMMCYPGEKPLYARNRGQVRGVTVRNLRIVDGGLPFSVFQGFDAEHLVQDIRIEGLYLHGQRLTDPQVARFTQQWAERIHLE